MTMEFVDTNIVVYAFSSDRKSPIAKELLSRNCHISVQVLNEFINVSRRKLGLSWTDIRIATEMIEALCTGFHPVDLDVHKLGLDLAESYGFAIFDALIVATALKAGGTILHSEDMHHGLLVEGQLLILNPFKPAPEERF